MKRLAIVIVNYNSLRYLLDCLESLQRYAPAVDFGVVVVDNASSDPCDLSLIESRFPQTRLIRHEQNLGFSRGCNRGIRELDAEYYLLLNPDSLLHEGTIDRCLEFLSSRPEVGILGCRVLNPDGTLQRACRRRIPRPGSALFRLLGLNRLFPRSRLFGAYNFEDRPPDRSHQVEAVSGSFLLFRHEVLETSGFLDEEFFLYGEDLDFCYRAAKAGWKIYYFADAVVTHMKRGSSSTDPHLANYHFYDAMRIFYRKHFQERSNAVERAVIFGAIRVLSWISTQRLRLGRGGVGSKG